MSTPSSSRLRVGLPLLIIAHVACLPSNRVGAAPERPNLCRIQADAGVSPPAVLTGETVAVTMTARVVCEPMPRPMHVAVVLETSSDHGPDAVREARQIAQMLVDFTDLPNRPGTSIAVISFDRQARVSCPLSNDAAALRACIGRLRGRRGSRPDEGIRVGRRSLMDAQRRGPPCLPANAVLVFAGSVADGASCAAALESARQAKKDGILVVTLATTRESDESCLRSMATSPRYYFRQGQVLGVVIICKSDTPLNDPPATALCGVRVEYRLPPDLTLVDPSARPQPMASPDGRTLTWSTRSDRFPMTMELRTSQPGQRPVSDRWVATVTDVWGTTSQVDLPIPVVSVLSADRP